MLMDSDAPGFTIAWQLVGTIAFVAGASLMIVLTLLARSRRRAVVTGPEDMIDDIGPVLDWSGNEGRVRVHGEVWRARVGKALTSGEALAPGQALAPGEEVRVVGIDGLTLEVEPRKNSSKE